jgi:hypothetical protein
MKELMALYVDFLKLQRENRENFMKAQASMVQKHLDGIADALKKFQEKKP